MKKFKILSASAGTGKTYRLSLEYLITLFLGKNYKDIIVMTFTKKACSEIKDRILEFSTILNSDDPELQASKEELIKNLLEVYGTHTSEESNNNPLLCSPELNLSLKNISYVNSELQKNSKDLKIFTIDGFINTIFKNSIAPGMGFKGYEIIDDDIQKEILLSLFEKIFKNKKSFKIFKNFLESNVEKNLEIYLSTISSLINSRWKFLLLEESTLSKIKPDIPLNIELDGSIIENLDSIIEILDEIRILKGKSEDSLKGYLKSEFSPYLDLKEIDKLDFIMKKWTLFFGNGKVIWNGTKTKSTKAVDISSEMEKINFYFERLKKNISTELYNSKILPYERDVLTFIEELYSNYDNIKMKEKKLTHSDISNYTFKHYLDPNLNLFKNGQITDYFKDIFDSNMDTLFIDEFQDTSILQWKLLKGIAESSKNFIAVGDEKQSIYGWRGGEKGLFEKLPSIMNGKKEELTTSYRSKKDLIEFTNSLFTNMSLSYKDLDEKFNSSWYFSKINAINNNPGYIEIIDKVDKTNNDREENDSNDQIVNILLQRFKNNYRSIAVIGRSNSQLSSLSLKLSENNIPYILESNDTLFEHKANYTTFKFLKYLVQNDIFSLIESLRSDIIGLDMKSLKYILENQFELDLFFKSQLNKEEFSNLTFLMKIKNLVNLYLQNEKNFLVEFIKQFDIISTHNTPRDIKNIYRFIELSKEFPTLFNFLETYENNPSSPLFKQIGLEVSNAVTLITTHKSKGLEYDTVFYIYKKPTNRSGDLKLEFAVELDDKYINLTNFLLLNKNYKKILPSLGLYSFIEFSDFKEIQEQINVHYVALTRAKTNLFIVLNSYNKSSPDLFKNSLDFVELPERELLIEDLQPEKPIIEPKISFLDFSTIVSSEEFFEENSLNLKNKLEFFGSTSEIKRILGTAIHFYLENIIYLETQEIETAKIKTISQFGTILGQENLKTILNSDELKNQLFQNEYYFSKDWDIVIPEFEFKIEGTLYRIDRIMIKHHTISSKGKIFILDYKTGKDDKEQLSSYVKAIEELLLLQKEYDNYIVESAFLIINL